MYSRKGNLQEPPQGKIDPRSASYLKPIVQKKATTSIKESVVNKYTNLSFSLTGRLQKFRQVFTGESRMQYPGYVYILGRRFSSRTQAIQYFHTLIWFSYRKIPGITKEINSDTSWGCLIRVGQMAFAAGLKRHLILKTKYSQKTINSNIIPAFLDHEDRSCKYSLTKIVQEAQQLFSINYGEWFTTSQICSTLDVLHRKNPMRGTQDLKTIYYPYSQLFISEVCELMGAPLCTCKKRRIACPYCQKASKKEQTKDIQSIAMNSKNFDISKSLASNSNSKFQGDPSRFHSIYEERREVVYNHVLVFVNCQLSLNSKVPETKYKQLKEILTLDCSLGIIGGIPRKGLFFVGYDQNDNKLIYLDPHYVQEEVKLYNLLEMMGTFFCKDMRKCGREEMDPSLAFAFFIEDLKALQKLHEKLEQIAQKFEDYILSMEWQNNFPEEEKQEQILEMQADQQMGDECENSFIMMDDD